MKNSKIRNLFQNHLAKYMPEFAMHRNLVYMQPVRHVLKSLHFDTSSFSKSLVYVDMFIQPLFVPEGGWAMGNGKRLLGLDFQSQTETAAMKRLIAAIQKEVLPTFVRVGNEPKDVLLLNLGKTDDYSIRSTAFSLIALDSFLKASELLNDLASRLHSEAGKGGNDLYFEEMLSPIEEMLNLLHADPEAAKRRVEQYRQDAIHKLGLPTSQEN